jgi:hypothetical protein
MNVLGQGSKLRPAYFRGRRIVVHMAMAGPCPGRQFSSQVGTSNTRPAAVRIRSTHLPCGPLSSASGRKIPEAIIIAAVQGILFLSRSSQHPCSSNTRLAWGGRSPASATPPDRASHIATMHHESERRPVCANLIFRHLMLKLVSGTSVVNSRCRRASRDDNSTVCFLYETDVIRVFDGRIVASATIGRKRRFRPSRRQTQCRGAERAITSHKETAHWVLCFLPRFLSSHGSHFVGSAAPKVIDRGNV